MQSLRSYIIQQTRLTRSSRALTPVWAVPGGLKLFEARRTFAQTSTEAIPLDTQAPLEVSTPHDSATTARTAVSALLTTTGIPLISTKSYTRNLVSLRVRREATRWASYGLLPDRYEMHIAPATDMATIAFGHTHLDVQVHIALFTLLVRCIRDEDRPVSNLALESFASRMASGAHQLDPVLDCLVESFSRMSWYFLPHASRSAMAAAMDFISATLFERESRGMNMKLREGALLYVENKKTKNALGGVYGFMVWDKLSFPKILSYVQTIPDSMVFLSSVNAILSFYKDELDGDRRTYIHERALVTQKSVPSVMADVVKEVSASVQRIRSVLPEREKNTWERFMTSYVAYHYMSPRFHLQELTETRAGA